MMRFVVDDGAFHGWDGIATMSLNDEIAFFVDLLKHLRENRTPVGIVGGWGAMKVTAEDDLATILSHHDSVIDRDLRQLMLGLLGKCEIWDDNPSVVVSDDALRVDGKSYASLGVAYAVDAASKGRGIGILTMTHTGFLGLCDVEHGNNSYGVSFSVQPLDLKYFYRSLYALENVRVTGFFDTAAKAFPDLCFADRLDFSRFDGGYSLRDEVVRHLSVLNDNFLNFYRSENGNSAQISIHIGIDVSIEGNTRSSERLMAMRDISYEGSAYRCEWHSKIEPHRNRVHFHPGDSLTQNKILIGIFVGHLPT
jgi:hypothetical protein